MRKGENVQFLVWLCFPLLYIGYLVKSFFKDHSALAVVPALNRYHTCYNYCCSLCCMCKVLTKMRHCMGVIQEHNNNRMINYSGKWVKPTILAEGSIDLKIHCRNFYCKAKWRTTSFKKEKKTQTPGYFKWQMLSPCAPCLEHSA